MINLLIALMASTYEDVRENATLGWRLGFVRMVLRKEATTADQTRDLHTARALPPPALD